MSYSLEWSASEPGRADAVAAEEGKLGLVTMGISSTRGVGDTGLAVMLTAEEEVTAAGEGG